MKRFLLLAIAVVAFVGCNNAFEDEFEEVAKPAKPANNEIWYTATEKVEPYRSDVFGATLLSNIYDPTTKKGVLTFDSDVTQIGYKAFYECKTLTSVTIGDSVTTIESQAFYECEKLKCVYSKPTTPPSLGDWAFNGTNIRMVYVPSGCVEIYKQKWGNVCSNFEEYNFE